MKILKNIFIISLIILLILSAGAFAISVMALMEYKNDMTVQSFRTGLMTQITCIAVHVVLIIFLIKRLNKNKRTKTADNLSALSYCSETTEITPYRKRNEICRKKNDIMKT